MKRRTTNNIYIAFVIFLFSPIISIENANAGKLGEAVFGVINSFSDRKTVIEALEFSAEEINKNLPKMLNAEIRYDKAMVGPGKKITYYYTFINQSHSTIEQTYFKNMQKSTVTIDICQDKDFYYSLEKGVKFMYVYSDKNDVEITRFAIDKKDCHVFWYED